MRSILTFLLVIAGLYAQSQVSIAWSNFPGGVAVAVDNTDNVYSAYWDYNPAGDIYLNKRDADGNLLWEAKFDNTDNTRHEVATWVAVDNDNNILVSGSIRSGYASPVNAASVLMKFNPDGDLIWRTVYDTDFDGSYTVKCVVDATNNIYVLGRNGGPAVSEVNKFNSDGELLWTYLDADGIGNPLNIKLTPDNHIVISGRWLYGSGGGYAKIDADGNKIWAWADFGLTAGDIDGDIFGNAYIVHGQYDFDYGIFLIKMDPDGTIIWQEEHPMSALRVEVGSDNNPVICGYPSSGSFGAAFAKYNSDGVMLWQNLDADGPAYSILAHAMLQLDDANNAYVAGSIMTAMAVCKINADGTSAWTQTPGTGYASAFAFGSDNSVYVSGGTIAKILQEPPVDVCEPPIGLLTNNISVSTARLNWTLIPDVYQYEVWYKKTTAASWKIKSVAGTKNKLNVKNLQAGKDYIWKIRTLCDAGGSYSAFSADQFFTTLPMRKANLSVNTDLLVYPNPASDVIFIQYETTEDNSNVIIRLLDMQGKIIIEDVKTSNAELQTQQLDVSSLTPGMYILQLITTSETKTQTIILNNK